MSEHHLYIVLWGQKRVLDTLELQLDSSERPCGCWKPNQDPLARARTLYLLSHSFYFMCMNVLSACMYVHHGPGMQGGQKRVAWSSGSLWDGSEPLWVLGTEPGSLQEQLLNHVENTGSGIPDLSPCAVARIVGMRPLPSYKVSFIQWSKNPKTCPEWFQWSESGVHLTWRALESESAL